MTRPSDHFRWDCPCGTCAHRRYHRRKVNRYQRLTEGPMYVDHAPLRARLEELYGLGFSDPALGAALDVSEQTVADIRGGRTDRTYRRWVERADLLTVPRVLAAVPDQAWVPGIGVTRRLQALSWMGYPLRDLGLPEWTRRLVRGPGTGTVLARTLRQVRDVYEERSGSEGPSAICRRRAQARGWLSPWAWDDTEIDDPRTLPYTGEPLSAEARREAFVEDVEELLAAGCPVDEIARRMGAIHGRGGEPFQIAAMAQRLRRYGRLDLARPFNAQERRDRDSTACHPHYVPSAP